MSSQFELVLLFLLSVPSLCYEAPAPRSLFSFPEESCTSAQEEGTCYNELECMARGGFQTGACPNVLSRACCSFRASGCDGKRFEERIVYFRNPSFPRRDNASISCSIRVGIKPNVCWIRIDFLDLQLPSSSNGVCDYNYITILNGGNERGGFQCGSKSGFSTLVRSPTDGKDLILNAITQGSDYSWNVKISQMECEASKSSRTVTDCGVPGSKNLFFSKRRKSSRLSQRHGQLNVDRIPLLYRRKLNGEVFFPGFNARSSFCRSVFQNSESRNKIIEGSEAPISAFPWIVSMSIRGQHFCGGSLINEKWVLTVAHCVDFPNIPLFLRVLEINIGDHDLSSSKETENVYRSVTRIWLYPTWYRNPGAEGDFALLKLNTPVQLVSGKIGTICLPSVDSGLSEKLESSRTGITAGWGVTEDGDASNVLKMAELNIISQNVCKMNLEPMMLQLSKDMICTLNGRNGKETVCSGDSGSPLMVQLQNRFYAIGAVSFSLGDCNAPFPAVFSRISYFTEWISAVLSA